MHSSFSCSPPHLEPARLRLDPGHGKQDNAEIPFNLLFAADSALPRVTHCQLRRLLGTDTLKSVEDR